MLGFKESRSFVLLLSELKELRLGSNETRVFSSNEVGTVVNSLLSPKSARYSSAKMTLNLATLSKVATSH